MKPVRDAGNLHDRWAIKVMHEGKRLGFVPCDVNEILARLMDGGKNSRAPSSKEKFAGSGTSFIWR